MHTLVLASNWAKSSKPLSRRSIVLSLAATAPAVLMWKSAHAQGDVWREFRRVDLGFRIEMPGEPKFETKEDEYKDIWIRSIDAEIDYEQTTFGVSWTEWKDVQSIEKVSAAFRAGMQLAGMPVTHEMSLVMNGFPARELIRQSDTLNYIHREVIMGKQTITASALGDDSIHRSPTVRRFFDSFTLLRSAR